MDNDKMDLHPTNLKGRGFTSETYKVLIAMLAKSHADAQPQVSENDKVKQFTQSLREITAATYQNPKNQKLILNNLTDYQVLHLFNEGTIPKSKVGNVCVQIRKLGLEDCYYN